MKFRRLAGVFALGAAASAALLVPGAGAQEATYGARSEASALELSILGQGLTAASSSAEIGSGPEATANGAGILNPLAPVGVTEAGVSGSDGSQGSDTENCEGELPAEVPGLVLDVACSASQASIAGGDPSASSSARVSTIALNPLGALGDAGDTPLGDLFDQIPEPGDLGLPDIPLPGIDLTSTISELLDAIVEGATLATIEIGDTETTAAVVDGLVTTTCAAQGATIDVLDLPGEGPGLGPLLSIVVGESGSSIAVDPTGGAEPEVAFTPALVRVVAPTLGIDQPLEIGQTLDIPLPEPIGTSSIVLADGATGTDDDGNTFANSSAVSIDLLNGEALMGGIELNLADCASVAGAQVQAEPEAPVTTEAPATTQPSLPRTGGGANGWALASTLLLGGLGVVLLRRTSHPV